MNLDNMLEVLITPQWRHFLRSIKMHDYKTLSIPGESLAYIVLRMDDFTALCKRANVQLKDRSN